MYLCIVTEMIDALQAFQTTTCILGLPSAWCCLQLALCFVNCLTLLLKESFITEAAFYIYLSATLFFKHTITRLFYLNYLWLQYQLSQVGYINFTKKKMNFKLKIWLLSFCNVGVGQKRALFEAVFIWNGKCYGICCRC